MPPARRRGVPVHTEPSAPRTGASAWPWSVAAQPKKWLGRAGRQVASPADIDVGVDSMDANREAQGGGQESATGERCSGWKGGTPHGGELKWQWGDVMDAGMAASPRERVGALQEVIDVRGGDGMRDPMRTQERDRGAPATGRGGSALQLL